MIRSMFKIFNSLPSVQTKLIEINSKNNCLNPSTLSRMLHVTSSSSTERRDLRSYRSGQPVKDEGTLGEGMIEIDSIREIGDIFPDENSPYKLFDGIMYKDLPVINIKATKNNTIFSLTDTRGRVRILHSSGIEGFKNARKGTNVAAQTAAMTLAGKILGSGIKTVKVRVQGLGAGRLASLKGIQMSGIKIVSITDNTHISWNPPRSRKQRRV